jgi:tRNA pseudouridine38-40 synthase
MNKEPGMIRNLRLTLEYLGTNYHGFQKQPGLSTIQSELDKTLSLILGEQIRVIGAGRTDAGVHATGQVANFKTSSDMAPSRLQWSANSLLPSDIVITRTEEVAPSFNARWFAISREYVYRILNRTYPSAFSAGTTYFFARKLNVEAMDAACSCLRGEHDFSAFCSSYPRHNYVREVMETGCRREDDLITVRIKANSFLHNMVRIIVGTLIEVGLGNLDLRDVEEILEGKDRNRAGVTAPAHGLVLTKIEY